MCKQLIILGGGTSIVEGLEKDLFDKIRNKNVLGLNYSHHYIETTLQMFVDWKFYEAEQKFLSNLPIVIGQKLREIKNPSSNIHLFNAHNIYRRDLQKGIYKATLCGLFALSFSIWLLDEGEIFLLGYDYGAKPGDGAFGRAYDSNNNALTHWYQYKDMVSRYTGKVKRFKHRGIGKVNWYEAKHTPENGKQITRAEHEFNVFANEAKVKIYNVSMDSKIPTFPKISYDEFFKKLNKKDFDQAILRQRALEKLKTLESK